MPRSPHARTLARDSTTRHGHPGKQQPSLFAGDTDANQLPFQETKIDAVEDDSAPLYLSRKGNFLDGLPVRLHHLFDRGIPPDPLGGLPRERGEMPVILVLVVEKDGDHRIIATGERNLYALRLIINKVNEVDVVELRHFVPFAQHAVDVRLRGADAHLAPALSLNDLLLLGLLRPRLF